tara:strand:+ start:454 stop:885 length:432 start_codon:yes stop_codon:yes gene_type:complete
MRFDFLRSSAFWSWAIVAGLLCGLFFTWELGALPTLPALPRPPVTTIEIWFTVALIALLTLNAGLFGWHRKYGTCPLGTKRATSLGGAVGALALLCPACILLPISLFGIGISLAFLGPFLPLLRIIALILLIASAVLLIPKKR